MLKLVTGEEIIGEIVSEGMMRYTIRNPVQVQVIRSKDGTPNVGFVPFPAYSEEKKNTTIDFSGQHVVYCYTPTEEFTKNYEQIFGLGLVLPGEKKIITG